jgi:hypothetical protein
MQVTRDDGLLWPEQAAALARVRPATIRSWVRRGILDVAGIDSRSGRSGPHAANLFRPLDVARAELLTRKGARRVILPPAALGGYSADSAYVSPVSRSAVRMPGITISGRRAVSCQAASLHFPGSMLRGSPCQPRGAKYRSAQSPPGRRRKIVSLRSSAAGETASPVSSASSRAAVSRIVSPGSRHPAGMPHQPSIHPVPWRRISHTSPSRSRITIADMGTARTSRPAAVTIVMAPDYPPGGPWCRVPVR